MKTHDGSAAFSAQELDASDLKIAIVVSRFNANITEKLLQGALGAWRQCSGRDGSTPTLAHVPGAFELPLVAQALAQSGNFDAIICLGCVIRGETDHYDYVCSQAAAGIMRVGLDFGLPVVFGVLTTDTLEQALERAGGKVGNKGADAIFAAVETVQSLKGLSHGE
jgi:6,7-dimethyl-8-ribityllumazine synthase